MHERLLQIQSHSYVILKIQLYFLLPIIHHIRLIDIKFEKFSWEQNIPYISLSHLTV